MPDITDVEAFLRRHFAPVFANDTADYYTTTAEDLMLHGKLGGRFVTETDGL
jgi:hypothetical protein